MPYKVIQWGAGNTGINAIRAVLSHPELQLVGLKVFTSTKVGLDAGELAGGEHAAYRHRQHRGHPADGRRLRAVHGPRRTLADPGASGSPNAPLLDDICRLLASGKNVIATAVCSLTWSAAQQASVRDKLDPA